MTSVGQHLRDVDSAGEAADKPSVRHALSTTKHQELRAFLLADSYAYAYVVCGHRNLVPEVHMPMSYAATGSAEKLAWVLTQSGFEGYVIDEFRKGFKARRIDLRTEVEKVAPAIAWLNMRWPRSTFKSSVVTHAGAAFCLTNDPDSTHKITTAIDEKAWDLCKQIGKTVLSGRYRDIFPDRVPLRPSTDVTESKIDLPGRTISHPQPTLSAFGYLTKDIGGHYDTFWTDDLVVGGKNGNATPTLLPGVHSWLAGMTGFFMLTRPIRRVHVGTCWDENDDDAYLKKGKRALRCFSVFVPIEVYEDEDPNILERGTPTMPSFLPVEKIQELQDATLADEKETEPVHMWRCNALLNPRGSGGRIFSSSIFNDPDRWWLGPYKHPKAAKDKKFKERFMVARYARDRQGRPLDKDNRPIVERYKHEPSGETRERTPKDWAARAKRLAFDPWRDLDIVATLDPAWKAGGNNWAITIAGIDFQLVKFQLLTASDTTGVEGWTEELAEIDELYHPRVIGFGGGSYQDAVIQNMLRTDPRLRKLRSRIVAVPEQQSSKKSRIKAGVAEPLRMYQWLLDPSELGQPTRDEMLGYKGDPNAIDGILDSMSMVPAVLRIRKSPEQAKEAEDRAQEEYRKYQKAIDPMLGVPYAA